MVRFILFLCRYYNYYTIKFDWLIHFHTVQVPEVAMLTQPYPSRYIMWWGFNVRSDINLK